MKKNDFKPNYIKCPDCNNILDLSFSNKSCPNPLCGFNFTGLEAFLDKSEQELHKDILNEYRAPEGLKYKLVITTIKHNIGEYLSHFIECSYSPHYNTIYNDFLLNYLDDLNILKNVLKSDAIREKNGVIISKNGYKMFWELYCRLKTAEKTSELRNFLILEFPEFHRKYYKELLLKQETVKRGKNETKIQKYKLL